MFTVEPGDGTEPDANSYVSLEEFVNYWTDRGFDYTIYQSAKIQRSLIKATQYIDLENGRWFKGYPLTETQPLAFPRTQLCINRNGGWVEIEGIPYELKYATFEYARRVLQGADDGNADLQPDPNDTDETGQQILYSFEKIGPIETKIDYIPGTGSVVKSYPAADKWLFNLLRSYGGGSVRN